jgi:hypothetical protein
MNRGGDGRVICIHQQLTEAHSHKSSSHKCKGGRGELTVSSNQRYRSEPLVLVTSATRARRSRCRAVAAASVVSRALSLRCSFLPVAVRPRGAHFGLFGRASTGAAHACAVSSTRARRERVTGIRCLAHAAAAEPPPLPPPRTPTIPLSPEQSRAVTLHRPHFLNAPRFCRFGFRNPNEACTCTQRIMSERKRQRVSLFDQPGDAPAVSGSNGGAAAVFAAAAAAANGGLGGALASGNGGGGGSVMNKYTGRPFSQRYYDILEKRKGLPVWQQRDDFIKIMNSHQTLVLVGETGSGKTTQVRRWCHPAAFGILCARAGGVGGRLR